MIVIDTSALIALLKNEADAALYADAISDAEACCVSAVSVLEAHMVSVSRGPATLAQRVDDLLADLKIEVVPFDEALAALARDAFIRFGKGRHPAGLNMGDCAAYALAKAQDLPLLFKGGDFALTDVRSALA